MTQCARLFWIVSILAAGSVAPVRSADVCPASHLTPLVVDKARHTLESGHELVIVALGSSSTEGVMASTPAASYPAQLQTDLQQMLPKSHIAVINRGIGGEDAPEEVARMESDAIAVKPALVIWQVGANGAMQGADPEVFRGLVSAGLMRMKQAGIDVVLMDNQRSPMILASPTHGTMDATLADLAAKNNVALFSRGALMDQWAKEGAPYNAFVASDKVHHNDLGYHCVAEAFAGALAQGLSRPGLNSARIATNTVPHS